jgi:thioredoxin:protein disulfide reductase
MKFAQRLVIVLLVVLGFPAACSDAAAERVGFAPFSSAALEAAATEKKPALIFATADWCGPCQALRRGALSDPAVKAAVEGFVRLKIDATDRDDPGLGALLGRNGVSGFPTLIFRDRTGAEVARLKGIQSVDAILAAADRAATAK